MIVNVPFSLSRQPGSPDRCSLLSEPGLDDDEELAINVAKMSRKRGNRCATSIAWYPEGQLAISQFNGPSIEMMLAMVVSPFSRHPDAAMPCTVPVGDRMRVAFETHATM